MRPHLTFVKQNSRGFSITEVLLVTAMISVIAGFFVVTVLRRNNTSDRTNTAIEIANYLQKARLDSMRRGANDINQMAQVKIFNRRLYSVAVDGDYDGHLDVPLVMSLPEQPGVQIHGPFPKTYIFDGRGQTVDSENHRVALPPMTIGNSSGASAIKLADDGRITVVQAVKPVASK